MNLTDYLQQQADTTNRLAQLIQPGTLAPIMLQQMAQLSALADFAKHFDMSTPAAQRSCAALALRREKLAREHAAIAARLSYLLRAAEKRGTATYFTVIRALDGDAESLETLHHCARRGDLVARCVLALVTELAALSERVLELIAAVAETLTREPWHYFLDLAPPRLVREGTESPNGPPAAHHALSGARPMCLAVTTSPLARSTPP